MKYSEVFKLLDRLHEKVPTKLMVRKTAELEELGLAHYIEREEHEHNLALANEYGDLRREERRCIVVREEASFRELEIDRGRTLWNWLWTRRKTLEEEDEELKKLSEENKILNGNIHDIRKKIADAVRPFDKYNPWCKPSISERGVDFYSDGRYECFDRDPETRFYATARIYSYDNIPRFDPRKFIGRFFKLISGYAVPSGLGTYALKEIERKRNGAYVDRSVREHIRQAIKEDPDFSWEHFYRPEIKMIKEMKEKSVWWESPDGQRVRFEIWSGCYKTPEEKEAVWEQRTDNYTRHH